MQGWLGSYLIQVCVCASYFEPIQRDAMLLRPKEGYQNRVLLQSNTGNCFYGMNSGMIIGSGLDSMVFLCQEKLHQASRIIDFNAAMRLHRMIISPTNYHRNHFIAVCIVHSDLILEVSMSYNPSSPASSSEATVQRTDQLCVLCRPY